MSVPIRFLTLVVKKSALAARYPGGVAGFRSTHSGVPEDEHLFAVTGMSWDDLQIVIDTRIVLGIDIARNCAVGDMFIGNLEPCEGVEIRAVEGGIAFPVEWIGVAAEVGARHPVGRDPEDAGTLIARQTDAIVGWWRRA